VARPERVRVQHRCSQRERLLAAVKAQCARSSLDAVTVADIVCDAGVSRPTFYEHFSDKEECFLAALAPVREQLVAEVARAVAVVPSRYAAVAATRALVAFATAEPTDARLLLATTLSGGRQALDTRDALIAQLAEPVQDAFRHVRPGTAIPDFAPGLLLGVTCRLLAARLGEGQRCPPQLLGELLDWLSSYELPAGEHRWRACEGLAAPEEPLPAMVTLRAPPALAPGRPRIAADAVRENHWSRIVLATADVVAARGYAASTVAQIARHAGLDARAFYRLFSCKEKALAAARELMFRHVISVTAGAFARGESWPARIRGACRALTRCLDRNPALAYVSIVEGHAGGRMAMGRLHELVSAFTIFLQEGYRHERSGHLRAGPPSSLALEATVTSVFELCYLQGRERQGSGLPGESDRIAFICLAPFLGAAQAGAFLHRQDIPARARGRRQRGGSGLGRIARAQPRLTAVS
jgi:AcrR family transcriptional regulator